MNLSQLYYFKKLAELQHYTKASKELYITQPSLSDAISSLEKELNVKLFQKEGRNIKLTKQGNKFYQHVCNTLNELEYGVSSVKESANIISGSIDIACIPTLIGDFLPNSIVKFTKEKTSNAKFNIHSQTTYKIIEGIKSGIYDLGFCSKVEDEKDIVFIPILMQEIILIVNDNHPLSYNNNISLNDIKDLPVITYRDTIPIGKTIKDILMKKNIDASYLYDDEITIGGFISTNIDTNKNPYVAIVAKTSFLKQFSNITCISLDIPKDTRLIYLAYHKNNYQTRLTKSYIDFITNNKTTLPVGLHLI